MNHLFGSMLSSFSSLSFDNMFGYSSIDPIALEEENIDSGNKSLRSEQTFDNTDDTSIANNATDTNNTLVREFLSANNLTEEHIQRSLINRKNFNFYIEQLGPSEADLRLPLRDYIFSECLKIFNKQINAKSDGFSSILKIATVLYNKKNATQIYLKYKKRFEDSLQLLCENSNCNSKKTILALIVENGQNVLDKPLYKILSKDLQYQENPEDDVLNSMRLCKDWLYSIINYTNYILDTDNVLMNKMKGATKKWEKYIQKVEVNGVKENAFKELSKLRTIHQNVKCIDDFTRPNIGEIQFKNSSRIINDYLYLKFKNSHSIYKCVKSLHAKIEAANSIVIDSTENIIKCYEQRHTVKIKDRKLESVNVVGDLDVDLLKKLPEVLNLHTSLLELSLIAINARFSELCEKYESIRGEISDAEVNTAMSWMMFGDEFNEAKETAKTVTNQTTSKDTNQTTSKNEAKTSNVANKKSQNQLTQGKKQTQATSNSAKLANVEEKSSKSHKAIGNGLLISNENNVMPSLLDHEQIELTPEQRLSTHFQFIYGFSGAIKDDLLFKRKEAKLEGAELRRAKTHSKELRDHLKYASLNFDLFCKAILSQDFYAIGAIIPFLCMDQHLAIEQMIKHQIVVKKLQPYPSHNLSELYAHSSCTLSPGHESFIEDFSDAMLQVRYPVSWAHRVQYKKEVPGPLKWMQYSQNLCDQINSSKGYRVKSDELINLCNFVFDSYTKTMACLLHELNPDAEIQQSCVQNAKNIAALKGILETTMNKNLVVKANEIQKKSLQVLNDETEILKIRKEVLGLREEILNKVNIDERVPRRILEEASNHLGRIDAVDYLQNKYGDLRYAALHHRNLLMFQWIYEQLYRFNGYVANIGELSWVCNHNLKLFHAYNFPEVSISDTLTEFNFLRNLHYPHENGAGKSLSMIQQLLKTRKDLTNLDYDDWAMSNSKKSITTNPEKTKETSRDNCLKILKKGKEQVVCLLKTIRSESKVKI